MNGGRSGGGDMTDAGAQSNGVTTTGAMETAMRGLLERPVLFSYGALGIGILFAVIRHRGSLPEELEILGLSALVAAWLPFWLSRRRADPGGGSWVTIALALTGSVLMGALLALDTGFGILALNLMVHYFTLLSVPMAILCGVPQGFGFEYSHRLAVLANPQGYPWAVAVMRTVALAVIGVAFRALAQQMEEREQLQASLAAAERRTGMLEERQRLAREIHDTLAQGFASIAVHLERAEQIDSLVQSPARRHVELARSVAREGLEESRRMLGALRPEILEQRALPEALGRVCDEWSKRNGVTATLSITGAPAPMHPEIELTVLRAVQEGLTNIARHAGARTAAVTLSYMEDVLVLDVQDDGNGFTPGGSGGGFGLSGMKERTERLQGSFSVESVPGEGTTISITLPVVHPAGSEALTNGGTT
jgi:signal transduction histidine kinase